MLAVALDVRCWMAILRLSLVMFWLVMSMIVMMPMVVMMVVMVMIEITTMSTETTTTEASIESATKATAKATAKATTKATFETSSKSATESAEATMSPAKHDSTTDWLRKRNVWFRVRFWVGLWVRFVVRFGIRFRVMFWNWFRVMFVRFDVNRIRNVFLASATFLLLFAATRRVAAVLVSTALVATRPDNPDALDGHGLEKLD